MADSGNVTCPSNFLRSREAGASPNPSSRTMEKLRATGGMPLYRKWGGRASASSACLSRHGGIVLARLRPADRVFVVARDVGRQVEPRWPTRCPDGLIRTQQRRVFEGSEGDADPIGQTIGEPEDIGPAGWAKVKGDCKSARRSTGEHARLTVDGDLVAPKEDRDTERAAGAPLASLAAAQGDFRRFPKTAQFQIAAMAVSKPQFHPIVPDPVQRVSCPA